MMTTAPGRTNLRDGWVIRWIGSVDLSPAQGRCGTELLLFHTMEQLSSWPWKLWQKLLITLVEQDVDNEAETTVQV